MKFYTGVIKWKSSILFQLAVWRKQVKKERILTLESDNKHLHSVCSRNKFLCIWKTALFFKPQFKLVWPSIKWSYWYHSVLVKINIKFKETFNTMNLVLTDTEQILFSILQSSRNKINLYILPSLYNFHAWGFLFLFWLISMEEFLKNNINHIPITFIRPMKPHILL